MFGSKPRLLYLQVVRLIMFLRNHFNVNDIQDANSIDGKHNANSVVLSCILSFL